MKDYLSEERLSTMISQYENVVRPYLYSMPDQMHAPLTQAQYDTVAAGIPEEVEKNYELYLESLEKPQPFYIGTPAIQDNALNLNWDVSYDFDAEDITYTVELATDYQFQNVIFRQEGVQFRKYRQVFRQQASTLYGYVQLIHLERHRTHLIIM